MIVLLLVVLLVNVPQQTPASQSSEAQKKQFIQLLKTLPHKGEFFTDDAVKTAGPYLPILLALTEKDLTVWISIRLPLSVEACLMSKRIEYYATNHFQEIQHAELKLFWAAMLFDAGNPSPEIVRYLKAALRSEARAKSLAEIAGPNFENLKRRILATNAN